MAATALMLLVAVAVTWNVAKMGTSTSAVSSAFAGGWRQVVLSTGLPPARHHGRTAVDSSGNGLLAMGGVTLVAGRQTLVPIGDALWRLIGLGGGGATSQWARVPIAPGPAPRPRWQFGAAYQSATDQWFVHGGALGQSAPCSKDTWVLDRASGMSGSPAWRQILTHGVLPPARAGFDLTMDWNRRTMTVFGGNDCINTYFHDVWVLTFDDSTFSSGSWARLYPDSSEGQPVTRNGYTSVYDTATARLFVYGGSTPQHSAVRELWILDHADGASGPSRWHLLTCAGDAPPLHTPSSAYDTATDTWTFHGGSDVAGDIHRELWRLEGVMRNPRACRWIKPSFTEPWPLPRSSGSAATLLGEGGFLIFGGYVAQFSLADTWVFTDSTRRP
jgi:hypothetical protein